MSGERDNDLLDALAGVLATSVASRMRSLLLRGYRQRTQGLTRVRGRIDHLGTSRGRLMDSGRILCRYEEQTVDLPRYRFVLVTLRQAAHQAVSLEVRRQCLGAAQMLEREGVRPLDPTSPELSKEQFGHFDSGDRKLVLISRLVRDMSAPEHSAGQYSLPAIARDEQALRRLFESAVRGFYRHHLRGPDCTVRSERRRWPAVGDPAALAFLPRLEVDALIRGRDRQIVVECKFAPMFVRRYDKAIIKPEYLRQIYSYASVFSGEFGGRTDALLLGALVDGSPGRDLDLVLDDIRLRVREVDLSTSPSEVRAALIGAVAA